MEIKKPLLTFMSLLGALCIYGQQEPIYSMYSMNGFLFNPSIAGGDGYTTVGLSARDYMLGFPGSPKTYVLSIHGRLMRSPLKVSGGAGSKKSVSKRSGRIGLGGYLFNDRNGAVERTGGSFTYAYHIFLQNTQLSFGLAASTFQFKFDQSKFIYGTNQGPEPLQDKNISNRLLVPDISFGSYLSGTDFFLGFSVTNLFQTHISLSEASYDFRMLRHYFLMGGKRFNSEDRFSYEPSFLIKATENMVFQGDLQMRFYYNQDYYLGLCYRTGSAVGILMGIKFNRFCLGYAFDYGLNSMQKYTYGSHELNIAIKFGDNARRYPWLIRY
jgi:type IX secretion system PorP/SprF family membrane protein